MPFILETSDAMNLTEGSPVLYRGVEVGTVRKFELNSLGDRVLVHIAITPKYQHLVRKIQSSGFHQAMISTLVGKAQNLIPVAYSNC